jgi:hypothetical protein
MAGVVYGGKSKPCATAWRQRKNRSSLGLSGDMKDIYTRNYVGMLQSCFAAESKLSAGGG